MKDQQTFRYRLDFLYQSIAVYAATLVLYLLVRGLFINKEFPIVWRDPILYLLSIITLLSVIALIYNLMMRRRIEIAGNALKFLSAVRERRLSKDDVISVRFGRDRRSRVGRGVWVISIRLKNRRRPARIFPFNFERSNDLIEAVSSWAGNLVIEDSRGLRRRGSRRPLKA